MIIENNGIDSAENVMYRSDLMCKSVRLGLEIGSGSTDLARICGNTAFPAERRLLGLNKAAIR